MTATVKIDKRHKESSYLHQKLLSVMFFVLLAQVWVHASGCDSIIKTPKGYFCGETNLKKNNDFEQLFSSCPKAYSAYTSAKGLGVAGSIFGFIGGFCIGNNLGTMVGGREPKQELWVLGVVSLVTGISFQIGRAAQLSDAVTIYNKNCSIEMGYIHRKNSTGCTLKLSMKL